MANVERLKEVRAWALESEEFDIAQWAEVRLVSDPEEEAVCGTTRCIAGYGASQAEPELWAEGIAERIALIRDGDEVRQLMGYLPDGRKVNEVGRVWFGLTFDEAEELFFAGRIDDGWRERKTWLEVIDRLIEEYS